MPFERRVKLTHIDKYLPCDIDNVTSNQGLVDIAGGIFHGFESHFGFVCENLFANSRDFAKVLLLFRGLSGVVAVIMRIAVRG